jgi:hypothetical protein
LASPRHGERADSRRRCGWYRWAVADPELLTNITQIVGVFITLLGAFVIAPEDTRLFARRAYVPVRDGTHTARARLSRQLPWLRRNATIEPHSARSGGAVGDLTLTVSGAGYRWEPGAPVDERIEILRVQLDQVRSDLAAVRKSIAAERQERTDETDRIERERGQQLGNMRKRVEETERHATEADAEPCPWLASGSS